jgi:hypothetical protein
MGKHYIKLRLMNGDVRTIDAPASIGSGSVLRRLRAPDIAGEDWLRTLEATYVQRANILEAWLVEEDDDRPTKQIGKPD